MHIRRICILLSLHRVLYRYLLGVVDVQYLPSFLFPTDFLPPWSNHYRIWGIKVSTITGELSACPFISVSFCFMYVVLC